MKKIQIAALLFFIYSSSVAQQTDRFDLVDFNGTAIEHGYDEKAFVGKNFEPKYPSKVINAIPITTNRKLDYFTLAISKKNTRLTAAESGKVFFTTHYRRNQLHGSWFSLYNDGLKRDSGIFYNNMPDGEWRSWYPGGNLRSIRNYSAVKYLAVKAEIGRKNEKIYYYPLTKLGLVHPARFEDITSAGYSFRTISSSEILAYIPPYTNCLHHGLYMNFYSNGSVKDSGYYKDGLRDGIWNEYYENGQLKVSGYYYKGKRNSGCKYYDSNGKLIMLSEYKNGKLNHKKRY